MIILIAFALFVDPLIFRLSVKKKIAIKFGKRFDVTDISQCRKAGYSICDNCEY